MNKASMTTLLLLVALGAGWLVGNRTGGGDADATDKEIVRLQEENARLRRTLGERGPALEPGALLKGHADPSGAGTPAKDASGKTPGQRGPVTDFDVTEFDHPDEAFQAMLAYASAMLAKGEDGHLALLETINKTFHESPGERVAKRLLGDEDQSARYLYPLIRFALNHDVQVVDMTETLFRTMAEDPQRLKDVDSDPLELFTQGIAVMLPGMVDSERLERFRGYVRAMLGTPESAQPRSVQRQRSRLQRALESWDPPISTEEALQRLRGGIQSPEEAVSLLRRLGPEDVRGVDLDALIGPMLEKDGWRVINVVSRLRPDASTLAKFDARFIRGITAGTLAPQMVPTWLRWTGRRSWQSARAFIEAGLQDGTRRSNGAFLMATFSLRPPPDDDWVDWAEQTYDYEDSVRLYLKSRREKREKK